MIRTQEEHLAHYGILRKSGRYPWGSGGTESKRNKSFLDTIEEQKRSGMSESQIADSHGITTTQLRAARSIAVAQQRQERILQTQRLKDKGWSNVKIAERQGRNESSVRADLAPGAKDKADALQITANMLKDHVSKKGLVDVGRGVEAHLGVTATRLNTAIAILREQGYEVHNIKIPQLGTGKLTNTKVLGPPGTTFGDVSRNRSKIQPITDTYSEDHGRSWLGVQSPISVNSRRVGIIYADDGGAKADGVIYVRPGVKDLSLGSSNYAQVRIMVDGTHYLKGMAVYKEDLPVGKDLMYNTNKSKTVSKKEVMKDITEDPANPFGAIVRQIHDDKGKVSSAMNIVNEEGNWDKWSSNFSSQMLSKQNPSLAKKQLDVTFERRVRELDEINSLTNPTVRKDLLLKFADQTDAAAVHLSAAALPRTASKVLLPISSIKPTEIYAPSMRNGERVALIRHPHGGTFEIPDLVVNNRNPEARKIIGSAAPDAVGIHHEVAQRLSGADFDGDHVLVIPNGKRLVKNTPALEGLKGFDPQKYTIPKDSPIPHITPRRKQDEMGKISNLITDMSLHGASTEHLARAIRHSMVVIDSEKHGLDFKQSEKDNGILTLKEEYQGGTKRGASTLISKAGAEIRIPERVARPPSKGGPIDPLTGKKVFVPTGRMVPEVKTRVDPVTGRKVKFETGRMVEKKERHEKLAVTDDAGTLSSGTRMEALYVDHSNRLKAMANEARRSALRVESPRYSPSAKAVYSNEVASLNAKLNLAKKNAPLERQAQRQAGTQVSQRRRDNPDITPEEIKKIKQQALEEARVRTNAKKSRIEITQAEWDAIQAGAISTSNLKEILSNTDTDTVKRLAMPKVKPKMTSAKMRRAQSMLASGFTQAEVADALGVGLTTLKISLSE
jgi:hypothetical protein